LAMTPRPVKRENSSITTDGNPFGKVGKGRSRWMPAISQCPVVLSFPAEAGRMLPHAPTESSLRRRPLSGLMFPRPNCSRLGRVKPPVSRARLPRVSLPASPYSSASGAGPIPTPSRMMIAARFSFAPLCMLARSASEGR